MKMKSINAFRVRIQHSLLVFAALVGSPMAVASDVHVTLTFNGGCPVVGGAAPSVDLDAKGPDRFIWHAITFDSGTLEPVTTGYALYFNPFLGGKPLRDDDMDGVITSPPVDYNTPTASYKFCIVGRVGCDPLC